MNHASPSSAVRMNLRVLYKEHESICRAIHALEIYHASRSVVELELASQSDASRPAVELELASQSDIQVLLGKAGLLPADSCLSRFPESGTRPRGPAHNDGSRGKARKTLHARSGCRCGQCKTCIENDRWERIFAEKFAVGPERCERGILQSTLRDFR